MSRGRASFHGEIGLTRAKKPHAQGFQKRMMGFAWKNSARAADAGNRRGSQRGFGLPN
jgi:hypothetical protein